MKVPFPGNVAWLPRRIQWPVGLNGMGQGQIPRMLSTPHVLIEPRYGHLEGGGPGTGTPTDDPSRPRWPRRTGRPAR
jgi:hypothetical protein